MKIKGLKRLKNGLFVFSCILLCMINTESCFATISLSQQTASKRPIRILSLDSGGIHGIISAYSLLYLEQKSGKSINQLFDLIVCVSTGAIQATMLTIPNSRQQPAYSAQNILNYYNTDIVNLLRVPLWWQIISMGGFLRPKLNSNQVYNTIKQSSSMFKLSSLLNHVVIVTFDLRRNWILLFDNIAAQNDPSKDFMLVDVIYSAISAPTKIGPREITNLNGTKKYTLIDGATMSTDPASIALMVATKLYPDNPKYMLSIGNGESPPSINLDTVGTWGLLDWAAPLAGTLLNARTNLAQKIMYMLYHDKFSQLKYYARINRMLPGSVADSFGSSAEQITTLNKISKQIVQEYQEQLDFFTVQMPMLK